MEEIIYSVKFDYLDALIREIKFNENFFPFKVYKSKRWSVVVCVFEMVGKVAKRIKN